MSNNAISISIVSHGQADLAHRLIGDLQGHCSLPLQLIITLNLAERLPFDPGALGFPVIVLKNAAPKGYGANHNAAFSHATAPYFFVLNPDLRIKEHVFPRLVAHLARSSLGAVAPLMTGPTGAIEDSARRFPTPYSILKKAFTRTAPLEYEIANELFFPEWVAGMFMGFRSDVFRTVGGFDERYFLYYEDVDLCWRLRRRGYDIAVDPGTRIIHAARRTSHRNLRYLRWHLGSMSRFFWKRVVEGVGRSVS